MTIYTVDVFEPIHPGWTADATAITADTVAYTADGGPLIPATEVNDAVVNANFVSAEVVEPVGSVWTADSAAVTADSVIYTADGGPLEGARDATDAAIVAVSAELAETANALDDLDAIVIAASAAIVAEAASASDILDATVIPAIIQVPIGGYVGPRRPRWVVGYGYGVLPRLTGEAHGWVGPEGRAEATLQIGGAAGGQADEFSDLELLMLLALAA